MTDGGTAPIRRSNAEQDAVSGHDERLTPLKELQLVEDFLAGDTSAISDLLKAYERRIYAICYRMLRNHDEAADLAQDSMVKVLEGIHSYDRRSRLSTWIIRVTMNCCLSYLRKQKLRRHASLDDATRWSPEAFGTHAGQSEGELSALSRVELAEMQAALMRGMRTLDPDMRALLVLRDMQGLEYHQISEILDVPLGTVKSRLFRARSALRSAVEVETGREPLES